MLFCLLKLIKFKPKVKVFCFHNHNLIVNNKIFVKKMSNDCKKIKCGPLKIGTHSGTFHCDEVLACFMLHRTKKYHNAEIVRSRDPNVLKDCDIVVDVGGVFDPDQNLFDHHQKIFNETLSSLRPEIGNSFDIKLSSAGLVYTYFGEEILSNIIKEKVNIVLQKDLLMLIYKKVYKNFIEEIDAIDNGFQICEGEPRYQITTHLGNRVGNLNPQWNSPDDVSFSIEERFNKAMEVVGEELTDKVVFYVTSWLPAREIVVKAIKNAKSLHKSGEILLLEQFCPWKDHLSDLEKEFNIKGIPKYVLFLDSGKDWRVICVPNQPNSFICRKFLHKDWRGLRSQEIVKISGIEDAEFCHATGFIGGANSREGVYQMALKSLKGNFTD